MDVRQRRLDRRTARNRRIAKEIRNAVERGCRNPQSFDDDVENQSFRLLEKNRPKSLFSIFKRRKD